MIKFTSKCGAKFLKVDLILRPFEDVGGDGLEVKVDGPPFSK